MASYTENNVDNKVTTNSYFSIVGHPKRVVMFVAVLSFVFNIISCTFGVEAITPDNKLDYMLRATAKIDSNSTLKSVASFPIGAAFSSAVVINSPKANDLFLRQFSSKTIYTYMRVEPAQGRFNFRELDYWVKLSEHNPIRLHGHCLVYHNGTPDWLTNFSGTTLDFEKAIKNHIQTIVGRYKGRVKGWDVINEVYDNAGAIQSTTFRKQYSSDAAYIDFVKRCFEWAHEADPKAVLFYSDFGVEVSKVKLKTVINMINNFKRSGVHIDGMAPHMHISIITSDDRIADCLRQLSATNLQIHISELDIKVNPLKDQNLVLSTQLLNAQRNKYRSLAMVYKQLVPANQQYGITLWDFSDADSWIVKKQADAPCIFDTSYNKKPAFYGLMEGLTN